MKKGTIFLGLLLAIHAVFAATKLPQGCKAVPVTEESIILKAKKGHLIFIHNRTDKKLWLTHPTNKASMSAGWTSQLDAGQWSALALAQSSFTVSCIESQPGHEQYISCNGAIAVCQWPKTTLPSNQSSTFWVAENQSLAALLRAVDARGFKIPLAK